MRVSLKIFVSVVILLTVFSAFGFSQSKSGKVRFFKLQKGVTSKDYLPNTLIIKYRDGTSTSKQFSVSQELQNLKIKSGSIQKKTQIFKSDISAQRLSSTSAVKSNKIDLDRIFEVKFAAKVGIEEVINQVLENENVEYAEPSYVYRTQYTPNDPSFSSQSNYLAQIKTPQAWDILKNSSNVVIGIVDGGSSLNHEDLAANIYINTLDPINGIDDDNDGYIDNNRGWDFIGANASNFVEDNNPDVAGGVSYHGVHVSGIASEVSDNGIGGASTAFNAKLLIVKVGSDDDETGIYNGYAGIKYAADHGAQIINCSWGGLGGGQYGQNIIDYAISKNCLIVAAAGNSGGDVIDFPAAYKNVMVVANVDNNDTKSGSSNFGYKVTISAPGTGIYSTLPNNTYGRLSGTSMASPMVASAAALVKSKFPSYNMQQVGEQLRVTADNIDSQNPDFIGFLGKGRLNVFRALTEASPSVRKQKLTLLDNSNGAMLSGDTVQIYFDLKNFLLPATGLIINLNTNNPNVQLLDNQITVGSLNTLESKTGIGPFRMVIKPSISDNEPVDFRIDYSANGGTYADQEFFRIPVSLDYQNIEVNKITTTITSIGRIGFRDAEATTGVGFSYNGNSLLYEASLMIGNSSTKISNNARNNLNGSDEDFVKQVRLLEVSNPQAAYEGRSEFDDSGNSNPLGIYVKHRQLAYASAPDDKYTIAEYEIQNKGTATLNGIYVGYFTDWDITPDNHEVTKYDAANQMGYVFSKFNNFPFAGVKLLSKPTQPGYYPLADQMLGSLLESGGGFSDSEKFETLSNGIKSPGLGENTPNGYDVSFVISSGPYTIPANGSVKVAFAFLAGDNLSDLQASAVASQKKYNLMVPTEEVSETFKLYGNYPNPPKNGTTTIRFNIPKMGSVSLKLYNILGQLVRQVPSETYMEGINSIDLSVNDLENGVYLYKMTYENQALTKKLLIKN